MQALEERCEFLLAPNKTYATQHASPFHQAITALGMGIALLLVARRIVLGTASVGDVPMVQGAAGEGFRRFGDSDGFLGPRFISAEKIPLNGD